MSGIDKRLAEAIRAIPSLRLLSRIDRHDIAMIAAAVAPLVEEARAEGYERGRTKGSVVVTEARDVRMRAEGYAAALSDATEAIKAEYLHENTGSEDDRAYDNAITDALGAVAHLGKADA